MAYQLTTEEKRRLKDGISSAYAIPFVDDIEDFVWEAILAYVKEGADSLDPLTDENARRKDLFDVVDSGNRMGWSAKSLQVAGQVEPGKIFELVIQRADIFGKSEALGFDQLSKSSDEQILGEALLKHWHQKIAFDSDLQGVTGNRICVLLKSKGRTRYAYFEEDLEIYSNESVSWQWTNDDKKGLQGIRKSDDFCIYRWYPNQKQLFERFELPEDAYFFDLEPKRLGTPAVAVRKIVDLLKDHQSELGSDGQGQTSTDLFG